MKQIQSNPPVPPRDLPFGLKAIVGLMIVQMIVQAALVLLIFVNPYPEWIDTVDISKVEIVVSLVQILWTLRVVIGVWTRRSWVWYWMMLLFAYSLANGLRAYFWGQPNYIMMFLNVLMVFYLNQSEVQQLFLRPSGEEKNQ